MADTVDTGGISIVFDPALHPNAKKPSSTYTGIFDQPLTPPNWTPERGALASSSARDIDVERLEQQVVDLVKNMHAILNEIERLTGQVNQHEWRLDAQSKYTDQLPQRVDAVEKQAHISRERIGIIEEHKLPRIEARRNGTRENTLFAEQNLRICQVLTQMRDLINSLIP